MSFTQTVVVGRPPRFEEIAAALPMALGAGIIFSWGDKIYAPRYDIPPALLAHEAVHGERQIAQGIDEWWTAYIADAVFRYREEAYAHVAEYQWWCDHGNRHERRAYLELIAKRLASPLYGNLVSRHQAETLLRKGTT